ncbi:hypothetical protein [Streptomyces sp. SID13726]|uniref:hypothetical protein n=1 Tax=Streptomyces sp. SID13726 TaxID=2706058 RepID=UPI0013BCFA15|nr:hypothetical protein [Streptomyces sp. SID13726]NEB05798.1 hypothetical protein [Streptomyces sp. SID13726]
MRSHPRRRPIRTRHPAALVAGAAALLATGCHTTSTAEATDTPFSVRFTLGARGDVQVGGPGRTAVRAAGDRAVTGGRAYPFDRPAGQVLVVLRHWRQEERAARGAVRRMPPPEEAAIESAYLVDTGGWALAELDGHPVRWLRRDTIRVDATRAGAGQRVSLTLSGPHGGRPGQVTPPLEARGCAAVEPGVNRPLVLPEVEPGAAVTDVLTRLRERCLDVQYVSMPGGVYRGTVWWVEIPVAGHAAPVATLPPTDGDRTEGPRPGDTILTDPSRPTTVVLVR